MKGFVYVTLLTPKELETLLKNFFDETAVWMITGDLDYYKPGVGLPDNFRLEGRAFSEKGEIKWEKKGEEYFVMLLTELNETPPIEELRPLQGEWTVQNHRIQQLVCPKAPHVSPHFDKYPNDAKNIEVSRYYLNGISMFTRLRRLISEVQVPK